MFSIKGVFKDNKIVLSESLKIDKKTPVIITFLDPEKSTARSRIPDFEEDFASEKNLTDSDDFTADTMLEGEDAEELTEQDYTRVRKHKRYPAKGNISLIGLDGDETEEKSYALYDYSAGGLSFISDQPLKVGRTLTASIKDPIEQDTSVLDFEFEVARVENRGDHYKIGCKFFDDVDEEIWHSLMS